MPTIDIDRDAAHDAAQRELAKPIYPKASLTQRFHDWVDELLFRLVEKGSELPGGWFTIAVLLILLGAGLVVAIRVWQRMLRTRRGVDNPLFDGGQLSAATHRATAERLAAEGNWTTAIRHRLRAIARTLEETRVLEPAPGRTANELARDAGVRIPQLASEFAQAAAAFNDVTYGERPGTSAAYQMIADLDDHLRSGSAGGSPAADQSAALGPWAAVQ
ncbi:hypothetical protein A5707_03820 [Mycobacterium kyorinense]|uniref:Protein-glutamine gamma-glutamyltransferase-like C-terminal domain-containing protein n=1 Tax=Mycobacterium kyorinense TaxID=487514 RepID=A0A1A2Z349_9MYCO|nr:DUF4129 domain-containing protein [Mycobacterium kyorinense]OBI43907.1 hypothetical protein A5707_03820 [Mycobacterium kyorinense]